MLVLPRYARQDEIVFGANKNADNYDSTKTILNVRNNIHNEGKNHKENFEWKIWDF